MLSYYSLNHYLSHHTFSAIGVPCPRVMYPLNHEFEGHEVTGRGSDIILKGITFGDVAEMGRPPGALNLEADPSKYAEIPPKDGSLTFNVSSIKKIFAGTCHINIRVMTALTQWANSNLCSYNTSVCSRTCALVRNSST